MQKQISFKSSKGYLLRGVLHLPQGQGPFPAIIVLHGFKGNHHSTIIRLLASCLVKKGFGVLRFSFSGHKPSGGSHQEVTVNQFCLDVYQAIKHLLKNPKINKYQIAMFGHSLGALVALLAASWQRKYLRAIVSLASPYDFKEVMSAYYQEDKVKESNQDYWLIDGFKTSKKIFNNRFCKNKRKLIKDIHCPVLVIHGQADRRVQLQDAKVIYNLLNQPKELIIIKGADHKFTKQKDARRVVNLSLNWFKKYLAQKISRVVNVFIEYHGQILLLKRSQKVGTHRGWWCPVGGYLEPGKSVLAQAKKEVEEELGLKIKRLKDYKIGRSFKFEDKSIDRLWHVYPVIFKLKSKSKIKLDWENTNYRWVKPEEIKKFKTVPMMKAGLKAFNLIK